MMNVIEEIAKRKVVETICHNIGIEGTDLEDLSQMIYVMLLEYQDQEKLVDMYARGELRFFIARMLTNNYFSKTSPWYQTYQKYYKYIVNNTPGENDDDGED